MDLSILSNTEFAQLCTEVTAETVRRLVPPQKRQNRWQFEADKKTGTVRWKTGEIKLTDTGFSIVSALLSAKKMRLKTMDLCKKVWGDSTMPQGTVDRSLYRLNKALSNSPVKICSIKGTTRKQVIGYGIRAR